MNLVPTMNPARVLRNAADFLESGRWRQGDFYGFTAEGLVTVCALGAIEYVVTGDLVDVFVSGYRTDPVSDRHFWTVVNAVDVLVCHLRRQHHTAQLDSLSKAVALARWNDRPGRTLAEVVTAMREAADRYANSGGGA